MRFLYYLHLFIFLNVSLLSNAFFTICAFLILFYCYQTLSSLPAPAAHFSLSCPAEHLLLPQFRRTLLRCSFRFRNSAAPCSATPFTSAIPPHLAPLLLSLPRFRRTSLRKFFSSSSRSISLRQIFSSPKKHQNGNMSNKIIKFTVKGEL